MRDKTEKVPGRDSLGRFATGNACARAHGLFARVAMEPEEKRRAARVRKRLEDSGVDRDTADLLAVSWVGAERTITDYLNAGTLRERRELFPLFERAAAIARMVLRRRDRALDLDGVGDDGDDPLWAQAERERIAGGES